MFYKSVFVAFATAATPSVALSEVIQRFVMTVPYDIDMPPNITEAHITCSLGHFYNENAVTATVKVPLTDGQSVGEVTFGYDLATDEQFDYTFTVAGDEISNVGYIPSAPTHHVSCQITRFSEGSRTVVANAGNGADAGAVLPETHWPGTLATIALEQEYDDLTVHVDASYDANEATQ